MTSSRADRIKHQLLIHIDYGRGLGALEIRYSYPFSGAHISGEQVIRIPNHEIPQVVKTELDVLVSALSVRILASEFVRLPHTRPITPRIQPSIATIVIQDQRPNRTPLARMSYLEKIEEIGSRIEKQVRMEPGDFSPSEKESWNRLRAKIKGVAWEGYKHLDEGGRIIKYGRNLQLSSTDKLLGELRIEGKKAQLIPALEITTAEGASTVPVDEIVEFKGS